MISALLILSLTPRRLTRSSIDHHLLSHLSSLCYFWLKMSSDHSVSLHRGLVEQSIYLHTFVNLLIIPLLLRLPLTQLYLWSLNCCLSLFDFTTQVLKNKSSLSWSTFINIMRYKSAPFHPIVYCHLISYQIDLMRILGPIRNLFCNKSCLKL